ncbi:zinc-dependent metalloprotease [Kovacikia minuta CCNUW1]|uniref:zinc-dependent metalloprotease n=1 Tax=Kovacikia minuta TaxID=2931930 RepID=UPI001CCD649D|nr:zinc-dependent metalloprotease [Kovacikia minuta]UBF26110.1 zinc-dependent metalloprotease [Kovacikia minuta CCNUW1]
MHASFARFLKRQYQTLAQQNQMRLMPSLAKLTGNPELCSYGVASHYLKRSIPAKTLANPNLTLQLMGNYDLCFGLEASHQLAIGSMAMTMLQGVPLSSPEMKQYVQEFLRMLIAHEVGHTLGLRHNFRASAMLSPADLNNPAVTRQKGLVGSVMDYSAVNLAPQGTKQGDYFTHQVGPYDGWAIAYGYTPTNAFVPQAESRLLDKISRQAPEADLAYATDEDTFASLDPLVNRFDLSGDLLTYAPWQLENAHQMWQRLDQRYPAKGESFSDVRLMFDEVFDYYFQYSRFLTSYIGGQSFNRFRAGDAAGKLPFEPIPLEKQRQALALLQKYVFDERQFQFSPEFINKLAPSRWNHWGETPEFQTLDYPIYDRILFLQSAILNELLGNEHLARLRDAELKTQSGQAFPMPELFATLQTAVWREVLQPTDNLRLSSLRRGLQREQMNALIRMVLRSVDVPEDARTLAWYNLKQLRSALDNALRKENVDALTRAHLEESSDRITKALNAQLQTQ